MTKKKTDEEQRQPMTAGDLIQDEHNYRKHSETNKARIRKSIDEAGLGRSVVIDADGVLVAGNGVQSVVDPNTPVRMVETDGTELVVVKRTDLHTGDPRRKTLAFADNATGDDVEWDMEAIAEDWTEDEAGEWGVEWPSDEEDDEKAIRKKNEEFQRRMAAGEDLSEDEEYLEFLDKFKAKKTTDDCYTPAVVYEAVAKWVENEYKVSRKDFVRPFYPGGDYKAEKYPKGCIVVDNPPFSILAEILNFYRDNGIRFFLFAPTLTLFSSSSSSSSSTALPCGASVVYENGASVNTSFLTNLEDRSIRFKSCPRLYQAVQAASDEYAKKLHKELPKYSYPDYVVTAAFVARLSKYGIPFKVSVGSSCAISCLDSQKETKKAIYGKGYLVSEKAAAEKAAAEKAAAEKAAAEKAAAKRWALSDRERDIIRKLSIND